MGKLRDEMLATGTTAPWLIAESPRIAKAKPPKSQTWALPYPLSRADGAYERDVLRAILAELRRLGCVAERIDVQGKISWGADGTGKLVSSQMIGLPDIIGCKNGRFLALEVKRKGGRVSGDQVGALQRLQHAGALFAIACGVVEIEGWLGGWTPDDRRHILGVPVIE